MVGDPYGTPDGTFARRGQVAHIRVRSSWGVTFGMLGFDLRFALVAFDLVSVSIWCEGVGVGVGARGGITRAGGDYLRGALGWEKRANRRTTNKARSQAHTQSQATQALHRGPRFPFPTALYHRWRRCPVSAAGRATPWAATPTTPCRLGPIPPTMDGASSYQLSRGAWCPCGRATASGKTPKALCSSRRCRSSSSRDSASVGRIDPSPVGVLPARVPDELPTASTRGGPKGGAPAGRCPSRGNG